MRKTAAFITALLITASFAGSTWTVSAEEPVSAEQSTEQAQTPAETVTQENTDRPENQDNKDNQESSETPDVPEDLEAAAKAEAERLAAERAEKIRKFADTVTENSESAVTAAEMLGKKEVSAAALLKEYFGKKKYSEDEEGRKALISDLCTVVLMKDDAAENEYEKYSDRLWSGLSRDWFLNEFIQYSEFTEFCTSADIDRGGIELKENRDKNPEITYFIQRMYDIVLGRWCDTNGLNNWTGRVLNEGKTAADVAYGFLHSDEYRGKNTSDEEYVTALIRLLKMREPEEGEVKKWVDETLAQGHTREAVLRKFVNSEEFTKYCESIKLNRGEVKVGGWGYNDDGFKCYTSPDTGLMVRGHVEVDGIPCYFDNDGTLRTDWSDLKNIVDVSGDVYTFADMEKDAAELQQQYPVLVSVNTIGVTADGRQIYDIIIGSQDAPNQIAVFTGMDGSEALQSRALMADAEVFLRNYRTGRCGEKTYPELFSESCIHLIPMVNPDGISISQFGLRGIRNYSLRERLRTIYTMDLRDGTTTFSLDEYLKGWKANVLGTDLVLNSLTSVPKSAESVKKRPSSAGYPGAEPFSENEIAALLEFKKTFSETYAKSEFLTFDGFKKFSENTCVTAVLMNEKILKENATEKIPAETAKAGNAGETAVTGQEAPEKTVTEAETPEKKDERNFSGYTEHVYKSLLRRNPDAEGWKFWTQSLQRGILTPSKMIVMFAESREFTKREISDDDFVTFMFEAVCGREASAEERTKYVSLLAGGATRSYTAARILELPDFAAECGKFGLQVTDPEKNGWVETPDGTYYYQNGMPVCNDLRNIDGFTYIFDKDGKKGTGLYKIGATEYYAKDGFVMPRRGIDWGAELRNGSVRGESDAPLKMDVPVDYQFLYTRVICNFGGEDKRVRESGCGAASSSMVIRYLTGETKYDPEYLFEWAYKNGQYFGYGLAEETLTQFLEMAGIKSCWTEPSVSAVTEALRAGYPVIPLMHEGYFTSSGHYIVLTGITGDGYVTVNDPNNSSLGRMEFRLSEVLKQAKCVMICGTDKPVMPSPAKPAKQAGYREEGGAMCWFDGDGNLRTDWSKLKTYVDTSKQVYSFDDMVSDMKGLKEQYPSLVQTDYIGVTADMRAIYDIKVGSPSAKKQLVIQAGCHGREYMGCMLLMNQLENLLAHYWDGSYNGRSYRDLLSEYQLHIIPMLNPDGITVSQQGLAGINSDELREGIMSIYNQDHASGVTKLSLAEYLTQWKANAKGVDINRNFATSDWADQGEIPRPSCAKYAGPSAASEEETRALSELVNSLSDCRGVIAYHSSGSMIYWDYAQEGQFRDRCHSIANELKNMTGYYLVPDASRGGGCSDWVSKNRKIPAFTIEIGTGDSPLPLSQYAGIWNSNRNVIPYLLSALG